jgi:DNA-directed RNA polymerase subunit alpha
MNKSKNMIKIPLAQQINFVQTSPNKGGFQIQPLYPGYGLTLGNALRRVLLSSLGGAAIEAVKITGADHEFSTLEWIKEDVVEMILNLKQVRIKLDSEVWEQSKTLNEPIKN